MKHKSNVLHIFNNACKFLDPLQDKTLLHDVELICKQIDDPTFRIALLAPFNFGKSTLLNALLGANVLPTKIVRTTGAAIGIKYGKVPEFVITFKTGEVIKSKNSATLKEFAVLDKKGRQRNDVKSVEVFYPHPLLKPGIELLDLPGTNDRKEQDSLVKDSLLQVDLVIQILDARQPFTLAEQENLRQWLVDRGISAVVFVLNWMNTLESEDDRYEVYRDVRSTIGSFKPDLPNGLRSLYRVDAKPALDAKVNRNILETHNSGIVFLDAALQTVSMLQETQQARWPRVIAIAGLLKTAIENKSHPIIEEVKISENRRNSDIEKGQRQQAQYQSRFEDSVKAMRDFLTLSSLTSAHQSDLADALKNRQFSDWQKNTFEPKVNSYREVLESQVYKACNTFQKRHLANSFTISFPNQPSVTLPQRKERSATQWVGDIFSRGENRKRLDRTYEKETLQAHKNAAHRYLSDFSNSASKVLKNYEKQVLPLLVFPIPPELPEVIEKRAYVKMMNESVEEIEKIQEKNPNGRQYKHKRLSKFKVLFVFYGNWMLKAVSLLLGS
jgi:GTPase SAR1 family protein